MANVAIQFRSGTTAQQAAFTGLVREITFDTSNNIIIAHDGSTAGGFPVAAPQTNQTFTKAQRVTPTANTDVDGDITLDFSESNNFDLILTANMTLLNPTNAVQGQAGHIIVKQDAGGTNTMAFGNAFVFASGSAPTLSSAGDAVDRLSYYVADYVSNLGNIHVAAGLDIS